MQALTDEAEIALAAIWETVLNRAGLGREDHFFASGGNSLAAVQAAARIADQWQIDFPVRSLFENPRLHECAVEIRRLLSTGVSRRKASISILPTGPRANHCLCRLLSSASGFSGNWTRQALPITLNTHCVIGSLDEQALQAAFNDLIGRHESLRTIFCAGTDGSVEQRSSQCCRLKLPRRYS